MPVEAKFTVDGKLSLVNRGSAKIAHALVYELPREAPMGNAPFIW